MLQIYITNVFISNNNPEITYIQIVLSNDTSIYITININSIKTILINNPNCQIECTDDHILKYIFPINKYYIYNHNKTLKNIFTYPLKNNIIIILNNQTSESLLLCSWHITNKINLNINYIILNNICKKNLYYKLFKNHNYKILKIDDDVLYRIMNYLL